MDVLASADEATSNRYIHFSARRDDTDPNIQVQQKDNDTADTVRGSTNISAANSYIVAFISDGAEYIHRVNGVEESDTVEGAGADNGDWFTETADRDNVTLGALKRDSMSAFFDGYIGLIYVLETEPTAANITNIESAIDDYAGGGLLAA